MTGVQTCALPIFSGDLNKRFPAHSVGSITISGRDVDFRSGLKLEVLPGTLSLTGQIQRINQALARIVPGVLSISGQDVVINKTGLVFGIRQRSGYSARSRRRKSVARR